MLYYYLLTFYGNYHISFDGILLHADNNSPPTINIAIKIKNFFFNDIPSFLFNNNNFN